MQIALNEVEKFLMKTKQVKIEAKLLLAQEYRLASLMVCLSCNLLHF